MVTLALESWEPGDALLGRDGSGSSSSNQVLDVRDFATGGDGSLATPYTGWDTAITWDSRSYYFPSGSDGTRGHYAAANFPNWAIPGIRISGDGRQTILHHTGTGVGVNFDGSAGPEVNLCIMERLSITGNALTTILLNIKSIHRARFSDINLWNAGTLLKQSYNVLTSFYDMHLGPGGFPVATTVVPTLGWLMDRNSGILTPISNTIVTPTIESINGIGMQMLFSDSTKVIGGTIESCVTGIDVHTTFGLGGQLTSANIFSGIHFEGNTSGNDILLNGPYNKLDQLRCAGTLAINSDTFGQGGSNIIDGGVYGTVLVGSAGANGIGNYANSNELRDVTCNAAFVDFDPLNQTFWRNLIVAGVRVPDKVGIAAVPSYANNAAAIVGGLKAGQMYMVTGSDPRQLAIVV